MGVQLRATYFNSYRKEMNEVRFSYTATFSTEHTTYENLRSYL